MKRRQKLAFEGGTEVEKLLEEVKEVAGLLWAKGWAEKNAGNISIRLPHPISKSLQVDEQAVSTELNLKALANACFFVTGTGKRMRDIASNPVQNGLFIRVNPKGDGYIEVKMTDADVSPTSELPTHMLIHAMVADRGTEERVVIHTHATELIALTQFPGIKSTDELNRILWSMHPETMVFIPRGIAFVPYHLPGSVGIASATMEAFKQHEIVLWEKHGVFALGKNIVDTFDNIDIACKAASIWFQCRAAGFEPEGLTSAQLDDLRELVKKFRLG